MVGPGGSASAIKLGVGAGWHANSSCACVRREITLKSEHPVLKSAKKSNIKKNLNIITDAALYISFCLHQRKKTQTKILVWLGTYQKNVT